MTRAPVVDLPNGHGRRFMGADVMQPSGTQSNLIAHPYVWTDPAKVPSRQWLWRHHLIREFVSATVAPGGVGKTALKVAEALSMVSGRDLLDVGHRHPPLRVWLLNLEDPREEMVRRIQAAAMHHGLADDDLGGLFLDIGREQDFVIAEATKAGATIIRPVVEAITDQIVRNRIDVLIIDPFVSSHRLGENDNAGMDLVAKQWAKVAGDAKCAIDLVHHSRKLGPDAEVTTESARGGKALTDACRSVVTLNRMTAEEGERAGVENHRLYFRTMSDKANLAPPVDKSDWYRLESVDLGNGDGRAPSDHVGVVVPWKWPDALAGVTVEHLRAAQKAVADGKWRADVRAKEWVGRALAPILRLSPDEKADRAKIRAVLKTWVRNGAFVEVLRKDEHREEKAFVEVGEWATD